MKYLVIALLFIGCNSNSFKENAPVISTERPDTIQAVTGQIIAEPALFETAFHKGTTLREGNMTTSLYGVTIGKIKISSGRIIACDPMHIDEYGKPFTQIFPTGEYPVQLAIAKSGDEETIAFARINFSDAPVAKWVFALQEGQQQLPLGGEKKHGYSVDAGVGVFIDAAANKVLDRDMVTRMDNGIYKEMDKHYHNDWKYALYSFGNQNLAAFSSGEGDGYYATYIGFDTAGKPCRLVTDFNLFDWQLIKK